MAQSTTMLQANRLNVESQSTSSATGAAGFGSALAEAKAAGDMSATPAAAEAHTAKKMADKKTDPATTTSSKTAKSVQTSEVQTTAPVDPKVAVVPSPQQWTLGTQNPPAGETAQSDTQTVMGSDASGDNAPAAMSVAPSGVALSGIAGKADGASGAVGTAAVPAGPMAAVAVPGGDVPSDAVPSGPIGSDDLAIDDEASDAGARKATTGEAAPSGAAAGSVGVHATEASVKQQATISVPATPASGGEKRLAAVRQPSQPQATTAVSLGKGQTKETDNSSSTDVAAAAKDGNTSSADEADPTSTVPAAQGALDVTSLFGVAVPSTLTAAPDVDATELGLVGTDSGSGLGPSLDGISTSGISAPSKGAASGAGTPVAKGKGSASDADSASVSAPSSFQKVVDAIPTAAPATGGATANANAIVAPAGVHGGPAGGAVAQTDPKAAPHGSSESGSESAASTAASGAAQSWDASATQVVHRAQLIQAMHQSEMRMGMNSAEFGNISISAAVSHQMLSAQISLNHAELSRALTAQLPDIEKKLGNAYGLPSRVEVRDGSSTAQQGSSQRNGEQSQGSFTGVASASSQGLASAGFVSESASTTTYMPAAGARLDILI